MGPRKKDFDAVVSRYIGGAEFRAYLKTSTTQRNGIGLHGNDTTRPSFFFETDQRTMLAEPELVSRLGSWG